MKNVITSRIELLLAKIAGRDVDISTMTPPVAINLKEELLLDIADRLDSASSELPKVSAADDGDVLKVVSGKWAKGEESKELPAVSSTDNGNVLTVVEGAWAKAAAPSPSISGLVVNCTFSHPSQYEGGYTTDLDADDIVDAYKSGTHVVFYFPTATGLGIIEQWATMIGYVPEDRDNNWDEQLVFDYQKLSGYFSEYSRTVDGKFYLKIYID